LGQDNIIPRILYALVGLAALCCIKYFMYGPGSIVIMTENAIKETVNF